MPPKVYTAGPEVFWANATEVLAEKATILRELGMEPVLPCDDQAGEGETDTERALSILRANQACMASADAAIANISPFRGPSMDPGTAHEVGTLQAQGKPVAGYTVVGRSQKERVRAYYGLHPIQAGCDKDGAFIENFGLPDNLMITAGMADDGLLVVRPYGVNLEAFAITASRLRRHLEKRGFGFLRAATA